MGGLITLYRVCLSLFLLLQIFGLSTEKPDLLRFILNVKPGIREPSTHPASKGNAPQQQQPSAASSGLNAISEASIGQGQGSKSASFQQSTTQVKSQSQSQQAASGGGMPKSTAQQAQNTMPQAASAAQKPNAEDPYGIEIGGIVETTTGASTKTTASSRTVPVPPTTIATTLQATSTTTKMPPCGPDVLFVLDSTGSVRLVYEDQKHYILDVAQQMDIAPNGQHVGLILYSSKRKQRIVVGLDEPKEKEEFLEAVRELPYHGGITATGTALGLTVNALAKRRSGKRTLVVVLTDGFTYDDWESPAQELQALGPAGVDVIVAGDVKNYARNILDKIAGDPGRVLLGEENKPKALDYLRCR